jgi:quinoprotein glucose dehydrogenase
VPELVAKGATDTGSHFPKVGPVVTAGGLIFTGTRDRKIRAFDVDTGKVLWTAEVEAGIEGIPAVYEVNGKQYLVYCAAAQATTHTHPPMYAPPRADGEAPAPAGRGGRGGRGGGNIPGAYVAFALPGR